MRYFIIFIAMQLLIGLTGKIFSQRNSINNPLSKSLIISLNGGSNYSFSDYENSNFGTSFGGSLEYFFPTETVNAFGLKLNAERLNLSGDINNLGLPETYSTDVTKIGAGLSYSYFVNSRILPFGYLGASYLMFGYESANIESRFFDIKNGGDKSSLLFEALLGLKFNITHEFGINFGLGYNYIANDNLDAVKYGDYEDFFLSGQIGISFLIWEQKDADKDGIYDKEDKCPYEEEDFDGFEDEDGCPDPDNDGDGILDIYDLCQNIAEDLDGYLDDDGCPDPDNDGDGIDDIDDPCPDNAEDLDGFEDNDGCPDADNDGDGIIDSEDECPDNAEVFNGFEDNDGCPDELPEPVYIQPEPIIRETKPTPPPTPRVVRPQAPSSFTIHSETTFETNSDQIKSIASGELDRIVNELKKYPNSKWRIEGYTDTKSSRTEANRLTKNQADAILNYFVSKGLPANNFISVGFGDSNPIASNATVYGKMKNRRIIIRNID
jgi:outer membrane protein OmpA-like peptidoglycan-associated protein